MSGTLYLVPNALDFGVEAQSQGPLTDVLPLRTIRVAARLSCWVAENAKTTRAFLKRIDAIVPLEHAVQLHQIVELPRPRKGAIPSEASQDMAALLKPALQGHDMGLISEAGLPAIADPGAGLVHAAHRHGVRVTPLTGPSSLLLALAASGLNGQSFAFVGYLPVDSAQRAVRLRELEELSRRLGQTQIFIETPYRNEVLMNALASVLQPQTRVAVSCGLTLAGEWTRSDNVAGWRASPVMMPRDVPAVFSLLA